MRGRLYFLLGFVALWSVGIGLRLGHLQVTGHEDYSTRAQRQQRLVVELEPPRGTIRDARGRELAVSVEVDSAWADPRRLRKDLPEGLDAAAVARELATVLSTDRETLAARLAEDREFVWLDRQLDPARAAAVRALVEEREIPGIGFLKEYRRYYPMGRVAAQVLGYAGIDQQGLIGLEHRYDDRVAGREGSQVLLRDARRGTAASPLLGGDAPRPGSALRLTLDATIQHVAERELAAAVEASGARGGSVVVLDPETGAVLALASHPPVDANDFPRYPEEARRNRPVMDAYEPGSTLKMVTAAAALSAGLLEPGDELDCEMGSITLFGVRIRDHKPFGLLSFSEVLARSSNVGAIKTGLVVGDRRLHGMLEDFGFGRPSGIDLPGENPGALPSLESWQRLPLTKAYVAFGQNISVTPLQLTAAFAAVANGGRLMRPYVVAAVADPETGDEKIVGRPEVLGRPLDRATARDLERMLTGVVAGGTGAAATVPGYAVAGKTGTAQKAVPGAGYSATRFVASFAGYVPVGRPRLAMTVVVDEPWPAYHGGQVAAPVFARIAEQVLLYLEVPPDGVQGEPELELRAEGEGVSVPLLPAAPAEAAG